MRSSRKWFFVCTLIFLPQIVSAKESGSPLELPPIERDFSAFWKDAGVIFSSPFHFDSGDWLKTGAVLGGTSLFFTCDNSIRDFALRNQSDGADRLVKIGNAYGEGMNVLILSGGLYAGGLLFGNEAVRTTGRMVFESALFAGLTTSAIKSLLGRSRPYTGDGPYRFYGFEIDNDHLSLPSGHVTLAFAVSSTLSERIDNIYASFALYTLATSTAFARIYDDEHWFSDTLMGAAIGTAVGVTISHSADGKSDNKTSFRLTPFIGGMRVDYMF